jgi:hypothetical protein
MSHGNFRISSLLAKGRMNRVLPTVSSSTIFVILTLPTFQCMRRFSTDREAGAERIDGASFVRFD